jgi:hypothetical protein
VYALAIPAAIISFILMQQGLNWRFWLGGFLFIPFSIFGFFVDYIRKIQWRKPINLIILIPYILLYLAMIMFYWWPLLLISKSLWLIYAILYVISTILNITSH